MERTGSVHAAAGTSHHLKEIRRKFPGGIKLQQGARFAVNAVDLLRIQLEDDVKRRVLGADGVYYRVKQEKGLSSQDYFCKQAMEEAKVQKETKKTIEETRRFEPLYRENQR